MTILCDDEGKFQIIHWPPLPVGDSIVILQLLDVRNTAMSIPDDFLWIYFRNICLPSKKFLIEQLMSDVNVDLRLILFALSLRIGFF